jgi:hypothetical protein
MLVDIKNQFPIFFFDSTGTINKEIVGQKLTYFYTVTIYNREKKCYIPIIEFFTTDQSQRSVTQFLTSASIKISEYQKKLSANQELIEDCIFVTDQSSVLINSILKTFNKCTLSQYIQWTYDILIDGKDDINYFKIMKTLIYNCATHLLKNVLKQTEKITKNVKVKKAFVFCFSLIQNSTDLDQIEKYIKMIFMIFNTQIKDENVSTALSLLGEEVQLRNLNYMYRSIKKFKSKSVDSEKNIIYFIKQENKNDIYSNSPYTNYYGKIFEQNKNESYLKNLSSEKNTQNFNQFYCPNLISIIEDKMYIIPLWSGMMLKVFEKHNKKRKCLLPNPFTRLTNNPAESRIRIVKNNIFKIERKNKTRKRCSLNEIKTKLFNNVKAIHKTYFKFRRRIRINNV